VHAVVVGCGRVGAGLANALEGAGHTVAVIDRNPRSFRRLAHDFAGKRITGPGFDRDRLHEAGIEQAAAVAAVTNGDNSNIVVARVAREAFDIERVVARIYDPRRAAIYERLGIPTIASVQWTTDRILHYILPDAQASAWSDPSTFISLVERPVPDHWAGRTVSELEIPGGARVAALTRLGQALIPTPDLLLQEGDVLWSAVHDSTREQWEALVADKPEPEAHH
jgi:trk system potassium uptake protein TrkA